MEIEKIKITEIIPTEYNPRTISKETYLKLINSLEEFGMVDPIIINLKNNHIIGGHQRYDILMVKYVNEEIDNELNLIKLGNIGWVFQSTELKVVDENHEKALNIALNKIRGEWDNNKLNEILENINFDMGKLGYEIYTNNTILSTENTLRRQDNENALLLFGNYRIFIPNEEYDIWKDKLIDESEETGISCEDIIFNRLFGEE